MSIAKIISFQQLLKRTPPGPFPRGATSPLSRRDEPGGGRRGQPSGVRLPVGMTSGWLLGACAGLVGRQQLRPATLPTLLSAPSPSWSEAPNAWREGARATLPAQSSGHGPLSATFPARPVCRGGEPGAPRWARIQVFGLKEGSKSPGWAC